MAERSKICGFFGAVFGPETSSARAEEKQSRVAMAERRSLERVKVMALLKIRVNKIAV
jgi:hypothetical protein